MTNEISNTIAIFSLIIAFLAYRHSVRQGRHSAKQFQEISNSHLRSDSDIAIGKASQKYVTLLSDIDKEFEQIIEKISYPALNASTNIGSVFDDFDTEKHTHPYLRHAFHT